MKSHGICSPTKSSHDKTLLLTIYVIGMFISDSLVKSYPSWDLPTTITDFGRNIRQLPCVSRRTGETGVCMFAYSCAKVNGTHLGTCIDRFYFGSCCKTQADLDVGEPDNYLNSLDNEVAGRPPQTTSGTKIGSPSSPSGSTDRYSSPSTAAFQSSYKPTAQFAVHSTPSSTSSTTTTSTTTSRTQYTEVTVSTGTKQPAPPTFASSSPSSVSSTYTTTVAQSTRPAVTTTFSTAKPSVLKPSPSPNKPPSSYKPSAATTAAPTKNKPQTPAKPTVQFSVPAGVGAGSSTTTNVPYSTVGGQDTSKPTSTYTTVTSMRPLNSSSVTATFSTLKPVVRPSSTTYKSTSASLPPQQSVTTATSAQKVKPQQTIRPATSKPKPPPSSPSSTTVSSHAPPSSTSFTTGRPVDYGSPSTAAQSTTAGSTYATRSTVENVTESIMAHLTAATTAMMSSHHTPAYGSSSPATPVTSTSPSLVTWTTLDKVPAMPSESTKPPPSLSSYRPSSTDGGSTTPSWVKLPVYETHEPSTASGSPPRETSTNAYSSSTAAASSSSKPTTTDNGPSPSDNDIFTTFNGFGTNTPSTMFPASTLSSMLTSILTPSWSSPPPSLTTGASTTGASTTGASTTGASTTGASTTGASTTGASTTGASTTGASTTSASTITVTDSNEAADAPLNMSNYKDVCGRRLFPSARIVGGEKVAFGKWPWQISLRQWRTSTYLHKCGAALFNENWAVTAAHCVENVPPSDLLLRLGEHDLSDEEEPYGYEERRIQIVASHPQFDPRTFEYDLALLRFYEPVKFQPNIIPVCVPDDDSSFVGSSAYVTGWGRLYEDGPLPSVLQEVTVPVINNSVCETMYRSAGYIEHIPNIFICAGWKKGGFDSCEGDSGGPMVIQRPDKRWMLAGIISWGIGCAEPNQPGVYTRISKFKDWINQILQF